MSFCHLNFCLYLVWLRSFLCAILVNGFIQRFGALRRSGFENQNFQPCTNVSKTIFSFAKLQKTAKEKWFLRTKSTDFQFRPKAALLPNCLLCDVLLSCFISILLFCVKLRNFKIIKIPNFR